MTKNILQLLLVLFFLKHSYPENKASRIASSFLAYVTNLNKYMSGKSPLISSKCSTVLHENYLNHWDEFS